MMMMMMMMMIMIMIMIMIIIMINGSFSTTNDGLYTENGVGFMKGEMGGDLEWAMLLRLETPLDAQCWLLRYAMDGIGTNEDIIAR